MTCALLLFVVPSMALTYSPAPQPCSPDAKANRELQSEALSVARLVFADAKAQGECRLFGDAPQVRLAPLDVIEDGVQFRVEPMVVKQNGGWVLVPFGDRSSLKSAAVRIKSEPVAKRAFTQKLFCIAATDAPGRTAWFRCSRAPYTAFESTPSSGYLDGLRTEFEFARYVDPPKKCGCSDFPLENYSMPLVLFPQDAPGWCTARAAAGVQAFLKAHTVEQVTVARNHGYVVKLRAADGATHEEPVATGSCFCSPLPACPK